MQDCNTSSVLANADTTVLHQTIKLFLTNPRCDTRINIWSTCPLTTNRTLTFDHWRSHPEKVLYQQSSMDWANYWKFRISHEKESFPKVWPWLLKNLKVKCYTVCHEIHKCADFMQISQRQNHSTPNTPCCSDKWVCSIWYSNTFKVKIIYFHQSVICLYNRHETKSMA